MCIVWSIGLEPVCRGSKDDSFQMINQTENESRKSIKHIRIIITKSFA